MKKMRFSVAALASVALFAACSSSTKTTAGSTAGATTAAAGATTAAAGGATTAAGGATTAAGAAATTGAAVTAAATAAGASTADTVKATQAKGDITIAVITHGDGGVFWSVAQKGAEAAGKDLGIKVQYYGANNNAQDEAQHIDQAVSAKVSGLVVSLADPAALSDSIKAAVAAGIPVITINSGVDKFKELGALTHVGQDEEQAGKGAGEKFKAAGVKHLLCVKQEQSNVGLEARCTGAGETLGGKMDAITTPGDKDPTGSEAAIKSALQADPSIDGVFATGPVGGHLAAQAAGELNKKLTIGSVDLSTDILNDIKAGTVAFTIDQQQYLQGYLPVVFLYLDITNKNVVGGGLPVATGPGFVDKTNVAAVVALVAAGTR